MNLALRAGILASVLLLVACAAPPDALPGGEESWLEGWVRGTAIFEFDAVWHREYPRSPHAGDSRDFEVAAKALGLRGEGARWRRLALLGRVADLWREGPPADDGVRERSVRLVGLLSDPAGLPVVESALADPRVRTRGEALEALGRFTRRRREDLFQCFGGRFRCVVFPEAPSPEASGMLLRQIVALNPGGGEDAPIPEEAGPERERALLFRAALGSLRFQIGTAEGADSHREPGVYDLSFR
jgi:hypothetical protein